MADAVPDKPLTNRRIAAFWAPLAGTWLMMAIEGPFLAALIARLAEPTVNLAAYGVAVAFAFIVEAPVIMLLSASTALVRDRASYVALRRFTQILNAALTTTMAAILLPPVFGFLSGPLLNLPPEVASHTHGALLLLLPWPGAIGYRRFVQGTLVSHDMTRRVAYGTVVRVSFMMTGALVGTVVLGLDGAQVGGLGLATGVVAEALASRVMAAGIVAELLSGRRARHSAPLTQRGIAAFYFPLAAMSILGMAVNPMVTFFMGRSRLAIESLAVLPVVLGLAFFFRSLGLSFQEVAIALMGERGENFAKLRNFATGLALTISAGLALIAYTPLAMIWFHSVSGLSVRLAGLALLPTRISAVLPALTALMAFQRALLVGARMTRPLTTATVVEICGIATVLGLGIFRLEMVGAVAAISALVLGRVCGNLFLMSPCLMAVRRLRADRVGAPIGAV